MATIERGGTGLGGGATALDTGAGLTVAVVAGGPDGLAGGSFGMLSSKDAVSAALQPVMRDCALGRVRAPVLSGGRAIALGTQRPSGDGFSPDRQGLLHVLSG